MNDITNEINRVVDQQTMYYYMFSSPDLLYILLYIILL